MASLHACLVALAVLIPAQAFGQGTLTGTVTDQGRVPIPLPGVTVTVTGGSAPSRTALTDSEGRYEFAEAPAGTYLVTFTLPGFQTVTREDVAVVSGATVTVDARMTVGPIELVIRRWPPRPDDRACLHGGDEIATDRERREDALAVMRLIDEVLLSRSSWPAVPSWEEVAQSNVVASFRAEQGSRGDLARRIEWGASEPLPGWRMSWRTIGVEPLYALTDLRDPCGFTLSSEDPRVIPRGYRLVPIGTY